MTRRTRQIFASALIPLALLIALFAWGASSPPGSSPDEDYHMGSIWCANGIIEDRCEAGVDATERSVPTEVAIAAKCFAFMPEQSASCPLFEGTMKSTPRGNWFDNGYPPVFYGVMSIFVTPDLSVSIVMMRVFNAVLYVGVLTALFFFLPLRMRSFLVWGAVLTAVPLGMFLIPSVNPSSWAILQATGLWLAVWGFFEQVGVRKIGLGVLSVLLMVIGAGARSDSAAYGVLAVMVAVVLGFRKDRRFLVELLLPLVLVVIAASLFLTSGQSGVLTATTPDQKDSVFSLIFMNLKQLPQLWIGALGLWGLGWLDTQMPPVVWVTTVTLFAGVAFWGLRTGDLRKWLSMTALAGAIIAVPMYILVREGILVGSGVQPRYVYPLMIVFAGVVLLGLHRTDLGLGRVQLLVIAVGLAMANALALHTNMRRYITGVDGRGVNLNREIEWWWNAPITPMAMWVLGSVAFAALLAALVWRVWPGPRSLKDATSPAIPD